MKRVGKSTVKKQNSKVVTHQTSLSQITAYQKSNQ